jgi:hypothetical protein
MKLAGDEALAGRPKAACWRADGLDAECLRGVGERQQVAWHASAAAIAHYPPLRIRALAAGDAGVAGATVELTAIDDHRDVLIVAVVVHQLRV